MVRLRWLGLVLCWWCLPALAQNSVSTGVGVDDAWGQLQSDGSIVVYMTLTSKSGDRLTGMSSPVASRIELNTHVTVRSVLQTRPVAGIDLPAGVKVRLEPDGLHAILLDVDRPLTRGQLIPLTLQFLQGGEISMRVALR